MNAAAHWAIAAVLSTSFLVCVFVVLTQRWHGRLSLDHDLQGVQKIHELPVPRIGGVGLAIGLSIGALVGYLMQGKTYPMACALLTAALPVFLAGLVEDLTKKVPVKTRLYASFVSAAMGVWLAGAQLTRLDTIGLDTLMTLAPFAFVFTCFAVGGMTNAINIIDGLNGLASGAVVLMLSGLATIAWGTQDLLVMKLCLWGIAAVLGFLVVNYPFGRIFLGDGGAYLSGFWVAECGVLLLARNPEVSTWAVLLCCFYPVWETVFSMYRRLVVNRVSSGHPDMVHLHHLIYRRLATQGHLPAVPAWLRHGATSAAIWVLVGCCQALAILFYEQTAVLVMSAGCFALVYQWMYRNIFIEKTEARWGQERHLRA